MRDTGLCSQVSQHIGDALNTLVRDLAGIFRSCDIAGSCLIGRLCRIGGNGLIRRWHQCLTNKVGSRDLPFHIGKVQGVAVLYGSRRDIGHIVAVKLPYGLDLAHGIAFRNIAGRLGVDGRVVKGKCTSEHAVVIFHGWL